MRASAAEQNIPLIEGVIHSSDVFYREPSDEKPLYWERLRDEKGCVAVEMEEFRPLPQRKGPWQARSLSADHSDSFVSPEATTPEQRQTSFTAMMKVALGEAVMDDKAFDPRGVCCTGKRLRAVFTLQGWCRTAWQERQGIRAATLKTLRFHRRSVLSARRSPRQ